MVEGCGFPPFRQEKGEKRGTGLLSLDETGLIP
jgi:hypothetical protein